MPTVLVTGPTIKQNLSFASPVVPVQMEKWLVRKQM